MVKLGLIAQNSSTWFKMVPSGYPWLETVSSYGSMVDWCSQMLTVAVMAILVTAPLGALAIMLAGPRLLTREESQEEGQKPLGNLAR